MASLVDIIRANPPTEHTVRVWGFDPDLDTVGWAYIEGAYTVPTTGAARLLQVRLGLIKAEGKGGTALAKAGRMIKALQYAFEPKYSDTTGYKGVVDIGRADHVFIEGQQVYGDPNEPRQVLVAKANDLLRLAQISGSLQALAWASTGNIEVLLPSDWKHQAKKEAMHAAAVRRVGHAPVGTHRHQYHEPETTCGIEGLPKIMGHAMDALCLAFVGMDRLIAGTKTLASAAKP